MSKEASFEEISLFCSLRDGSGYQLNLSSPTYQLVDRQGQIRE